MTMAEQHLQQQQTNQIDSFNEAIRGTQNRDQEIIDNIVNTLVGRKRIGVAVKHLSKEDRLYGQQEMYPSAGIENPIENPIVNPYQNLKPIEGPNELSKDVHRLGVSQALKNHKDRSDKLAVLQRQ